MSFFEYENSPKTKSIVLWKTEFYSLNFISNIKRQINYLKSNLLTYQTIDNYMCRFFFKSTTLVTL